MPRFPLAVGYDLVGAGADEMWFHYIGVGGSASPADMGNRISGAAPIDDLEHNLIAQALNELFLDMDLIGPTDRFPVGYR